MRRGEVWNDGLYLDVVDDATLAGASISFLYGSLFDNFRTKNGLHVSAFLKLKVCSLNIFEPHIERNRIFLPCTISESRH